MNYHDRLTDRERIRIRAQTKHEQLKAEAIDILIDAVHCKKPSRFESPSRRWRVSKL